MKWYLEIRFIHDLFLGLSPKTDHESSNKVIERS